MAMTYSQAEKTFALARNKRAGRPLQNNTRLITVGPVLGERVSYGVELHNTVVIRFQPNGRVVLDSGSWRTMTTKARINDYLPEELYLSSRKGAWTVDQFDREAEADGRWRNVADFFDGIELRRRRNGEWVAVNKPPKGVPYQFPTGSTPAVRRGTELAWHCIGADRKMRFSRELVEPGKTYSLPGRSKPVPCEHGFHGSTRLAHALAYHPGPIVCRVELSGLIADAGDKMAATRRRVLWMVDASELLGSGRTERMVPAELEAAAEALPRLAAGEATPMR